MENLSLFGDRVLVQLHELPDHSITTSGIVVPLFLNIESDGGRPDQKVSNLRHLSKGTVIGISALAAKKLEEELSPISIGDTVYVIPGAVSPSYQFFPDRSSMVMDFTGLISVPHTLIEAKVINNG